MTEVMELRCLLEEGQIIKHIMTMRSINKKLYKLDKDNYEPRA
jgi:hypothetical protein